MGLSKCISKWLTPRFGTAQPIEKAYLAYKAITTQAAPADPQVQIIEKEVPAPLPEEVQKLIGAASAFASAASTPTTTPTTDDPQASPV